MSSLIMPSDAVSAVITEVQCFGAERKETGGFLLAPTDRRDQITTIALAHTVGIRRSSDLFEITGAALERLFSWTTANELTIRAQIHSHRRGALLSPTDVRHGFTVEGFISSVVPCFAAPPADVSTWGWWECRNSRWLKRKPPQLDGSRVGTVRFDEEGIVGT